MAWNQLSNEIRDMGDLTSFKLDCSLNLKKPIYQVVIMGFFIEEHLSVGGNFILEFVPPIFQSASLTRGPILQ